MAHQHINEQPSITSELLRFGGMFQWGQCTGDRFNRNVNLDIHRYVRYRTLPSPTAKLNCQEVLLLAALELHQKTSPKCTLDCAWRRSIQIQLVKTHKFSLDSMMDIFTPFQKHDERVEVTNIPNYNFQGTRFPPPGRILRFAFTGHPQLHPVLNPAALKLQHYAVLCPLLSGQSHFVQQQVIELSGQNSGKNLVPSCSADCTGVSYNLIQTVLDSYFWANSVDRGNNLVPGMRFFIDSYDLNAAAIDIECQMAHGVERVAYQNHVFSMAHDVAAAKKLFESKTCGPLWLAQHHRDNIAAAADHYRQQLAYGEAALNLAHPDFSLEANGLADVDALRDYHHQRKIAEGKNTAKIHAATSKYIARQELPKVQARLAAMVTPHVA